MSIFPPRNFAPCTILANTPSIDRWNAALPAQLALAPQEGSKSQIFPIPLLDLSYAIFRKPLTPITVVHAAELPYIFGPSITPYINQPADIALSLVAQKAWISFAANLDPNSLGQLAPGVSWPRYYADTEQVLVFQKPDGVSGPVGQGLHTEKDPDDRPVCDFIVAEDAQFLH